MKSVSIHLGHRKKDRLSSKKPSADSRGGSFMSNEKFFDDATWIETGGKHKYRFTSVLGEKAGFNRKLSLKIED